MISIISLTCYVNMYYANTRLIIGISASTLSSNKIHITWCSIFYL